MHEINIEQIRKHLQDKEVQERIARSMVDARSKATVTISRAAALFGFSESQLREWEKRGLLQTKRTALPEDSKTQRGHRQFSPDELDKLALIKKLLDQGYSVSDIPQDIDDIWEQVTVGKNGQTSIVPKWMVRIFNNGAPLDKQTCRKRRPRDFLALLYLSSLTFITPAHLRKCTE